MHRLNYTILSHCSCTGPYQYSDDLRRINLCGQSPFAPAQELGLIQSPLLSCLHRWEALLCNHPDTAFASYILNGLNCGFRIGFDWSTKLSPAKRNIPSAYDHPDVVRVYVEKELAEGNMLGPMTSDTLSTGQKVQLSRVGIVPKGHNTGKWRIITDLSFPDGCSVNDGISPQLCSLQYTSIDKIAAAALALGRGTLLAKIDIKAAYRLIPVHPSDRPLLGIKWNGYIYIDTKLPFGLRSAPKIFNAVADALEWCYRHEGVPIVDHYLDDFITLGPPNSTACASNLRIIKEVSKRLGVPLAEEKCEGPDTSLTFLGIRIDTNDMTLSLPTDKLERIQSELLQWTNRRSCRRRHLESLLGLLHHAARVGRPGRSFLHRLTSHLRGGRHGDHFIRLNQEARADIHWWLVFMKSRNGVAFTPLKQAEIVLTSDASGSWGCGAFHGNEWFQLQWSLASAEKSISFKELLPIVLALATWGKAWKGRHVHCRCDNKAVVSILGSRYARNPDLMHLLRCLFFFEAYYKLHITASHIPGTANTFADNLSRNRLSLFLSQAPYMSRNPAPLPLMALDLLLNPEVSWSSPTWIRLFRTIVY